MALAGSVRGGQRHAARQRQIVPTHQVADREDSRRRRVRAVVGPRAAERHRQGADGEVGDRAGRRVIQAPGIGGQDCIVARVDRRTGQGDHTAQVRRGGVGARVIGERRGAEVGVADARHVPCGREGCPRVRSAGIGHRYHRRREECVRRPGVADRPIRSDHQRTSVNRDRGTEIIAGLAIGDGKRGGLRRVDPTGLWFCVDVGLALTALVADQGIGPRRPLRCCR